MSIIINLRYNNRVYYAIHTSSSFVFLLNYVEYVVYNESLENHITWANC